MHTCKLTINREGSFEVWYDNTCENQCGKQGQTEYKYSVSISAMNTRLTKEGYVMENAWCEEYFKGYEGMDGRRVSSCEGMAQDAIKHFIELFKTNPELEGVKVVRIYVRIHGSPVSFIECEWLNNKYVLMPQDTL